MLARLGDLAALSLETNSSTIIAGSPANESNGRFAPNGKWVVYQSDEVGGRYEIFAQPFPGGAGSRKQVSLGGGASPRWGRNGSELYFLAPDFRLMVVDVAYSESGDQIDLTTPRPLFPEPLPPGSEFDTVDGERFLINTPLQDAPPIIVLSNWSGTK